MTARAEKFTFQTRPTPAQNELMVRANRARVYRDNQAIADFQAARLRYEERQPEPCQFCAVEDEAPALSIREDFVITVLGIATIACLAILFFLGAR